MPLPLAEFQTRLLDSGVLDADQVSRLESLLAGESAPASGDDLARMLVSRKLLTAYQAQTIYQGKGKHLVLGNYLVLDKLGQGGMGMVLKARHRRMDRLVALKVVAPALVKNKDLVARFHREVKAAARLSHPHIVTAYDADEVKGTHFLVMEYVDGVDLGSLVRQRGMLPVATAFDFVLQAARGLDYAHRQGVIHRDIKPGNLLLSRDGTVKILDMGLARIDAAGQSQGELTSTGAVMGTVDYMSPEQAFDSKSADARADQYSLGCTLFYLLTAQHVYAGESLMEKMLRHREAPIPSLRSVRPEVPPALDAIFQRLVAKNPADRYGSMARLVDELSRLPRDGETASPAPRNSPDDNKLNDFLSNLATRKKSPGTALPTRPAAGVQTAVEPELYPGQEVTVSLTAPLSDTQPPVASPTATLGPVRTLAKPAPRPQPPRPSWRTWRHPPAVWLAIGSAVVLLLTLAAMAPIVLRVETEAGTIILEVDQPEIAGAEVTIDGQKTITINPGKEQEPIEVIADAKTHTLRVTKGGFETFTRQFTVKAGTRQTVSVRLEPKQTAATKPPPPGAAATNSPIVTPVPHDPYRRAAELIVGCGGTVELRTLEGNEAVSRPEDLPDQPFIITAVKCSKIGISDSVIDSLAQVPYINQVQLNEAQLTDRSVARLRHLRTRHLSLNGNPLTDEAVKLLAERPNDLAFLALANSAISDGAVPHLLKMPRLREVMTAGTKVTDAGLKQLAGHPSLSALTVDQSSASAQGLTELSSALRGSKTLKKLHFVGFGDEIIDPFSTLSRLRVVSFERCSVTDEGARRLQNALPEAVVLHPAVPPTGAEQAAIAWAKSQQATIGVWPVDALDAVPQRSYLVNHLYVSPKEQQGSLRNLQGIRYLGALRWQSTLTNDDLDALVKLNSLYSLAVDQCEWSPEGMARLAGTSDLAYLWIHHASAVTDESLSHISKFQFLLSLSIEGSPMTDAGVEHIAQATQLKYLYLQRCHRLTPAAIGSVSKMPDLILASFKDTPLDDSAVPHLKELSQVLILELQGTKISPAGIADLQRALPRCAIFWDGGLIVPTSATVDSTPGGTESSSIRPGAATPVELNNPIVGWTSAGAPQPAIAPFHAEQARKHQEEWAAYLKVPVEYTNSIGMKFRLIPPGEFTMGMPRRRRRRSPRSFPTWSTGRRCP